MPLRRIEIDGYVRGDTVSCLTWVWQSQHRFTCNAPRTQRIFTDGDWTDGRTSGFYRAILAEDARGGYEARALVQWIEPRVGDRATVRAITELPTGEGVVSNEGVRFGIRDARWYAAVISVKRTTWGKERQLTFELGLPGQVRRLPEQ